MGLVVVGPNPLLTECSEDVCNTVLNARAPYTRAQYENRWQLFTAWCSDRAEDPVRCSVPMILEFLQSLLAGGRSPATLRVYVAAISSRHAQVDNDAVEGLRLVSFFSEGCVAVMTPMSTACPSMGSAPASCSVRERLMSEVDLRWLRGYPLCIVDVITQRKIVSIIEMVQNEVLSNELVPNGKQL